MTPPCSIQRLVTRVIVRLAFAGWMLLLAAAPSMGQLIRNSPESAFSEALRQYNEGFYTEAADAFASFRMQHPQHPDAANALYYEAASTLRRGRTDAAATLFQQFQKQHPTHPLAGQAERILADYLYEAGDYEESLPYLKGRIEADLEPDEEAELLYRAGNAARHLDRHEEAITYLQQLIDRHPTYHRVPNALVAIGRVRLDEEQYRDAAQTFEHLTSQYPQSRAADEIRPTLAEVYYRLGDYDEAVQQIESHVSGEAARSERIRLILADALSRLRRADEAITAYQELLDAYPESRYREYALYQLGRHYYQRAQYDQAATYFSRLRQEGDAERQREAAYFEGISRRQAGQPEAALDLFHELLEEDANDEWTRRATFELGSTYYELQRWREANRFLTQYINQYPAASRRSEALQLRGRTDVERGSLANALSSFDEAAGLEDAPDSLQRAIRFQRAWLLYQKGDYADATAAFGDVYERYPRSEQGAEALFWTAESFYERDRYAEAARFYRRYLNEHPQGARQHAARYGLAWSHFRQQQYELAAGWFERFLNAYGTDDGSIPYRSDALLRLGDSYYALKQYDAATRYYGRVSGPGTEYALYQTGMANYRNNAGDDALRAFRALRSNFPNSEWSEEALSRIGNIYFEQQNYDQAIAAYRELLEARPGVELAARAQYEIGDALFNAGRMEEAVEAYLDVLRRYPRSAFAGEAASSIQYALMAMDDEERTEELIDRFAEQNPDSPVIDELRFRQAEVRYQSGRTEEALTALQQFVRTSGDERLLPEAYYYLGTIYADRGALQEAESYYSQLIDNYPDSERRVEAAQDLGLMYLQNDRYDAALNTYRRLENVASDDLQLVAEARYGQSQALINMGRLDEAEELLEDVVNRAPDEPATISARLGLARIYEERGDRAQAGDLYRQIAEESRGDTGAEALFRLGALHLQQGNAGFAVETLSRMPTLFPGAGQWLARSYLAQARAFVQMGQTGEAVRMYDRVIDEYSGTSFAETARQEKETL